MKTSNLLHNQNVNKLITGHEQSIFIHIVTIFDKESMCGTSLFSSHLIHASQPLTNLSDKKCKRCGFYEHDIFKYDDVFNEWEFCASDFTSSDGKYNRFQDKEFNATFLCPDCVSLGNASEHSSASHNGKTGMHWMLAILISASILIVLVFGAVLAYRYWQKRKRQQEQARFLKLFEEGDEIEDELGIGPLSHVI